MFLFIEGRESEGTMLYIDVGRWVYILLMVAELSGDWKYQI